MLTVDQYARIRRAKRDGMSIRAIARTFHHSRRKIREVLANAEPRPYTRREEAPAPKLGPFHGIIRSILECDAEAPPKQRHTLMRIFERLRDEHGYAGGYDAVRRYVGKLRQRERETFIPLAHDPGQRLEADFGQIYVDFPEGRRAVSVLILVWSYSNCPFAMALPTERTEAILEGMVQGLEFFGCVPREVWWDNAKSVTRELLRGRDRRLNARYAALASHYVFEPLFCLPARGNEKPYAENRVKRLQRRWSTPVPRVRDLDALNAYLRECCLKDRQRRSGARVGTIAERFQEDRAAAAALPRQRFDPCLLKPAKVDKYQLVRFDGVCYSVPRRCAFGSATVKAYTDRIEVVVGDQVVATHRRSYEAGEQILDPLHYLVTLGRRPAALDHSAVYRHWKLPSVFERFRAQLEARHGPRAGVRHYVRILQLLGEHPVARVQRALEECCVPAELDAERIVRRTRQLAAKHEEPPVPESLGVGRQELFQVRVPSVDLTHFDRFLAQGGAEDGEQSDDAVEGELEATAFAHDGGGVREAGAGGGVGQPGLRGVPAAADRIGSGHAHGQCAGRAHQAGFLSGGEGVGQLRLFRPCVVEQAANSGTGPR
jgi:transposase